MTENVFYLDGHSYYYVATLFQTLDVSIKNTSPLQTNHLSWNFRVEENSPLLSKIILSSSCLKNASCGFDPSHECITKSQYHAGIFIHYNLFVSVEGIGSHQWQGPQKTQRATLSKAFE